MVHSCLISNLLMLGLRSCLVGTSEHDQGSCWMVKAKRNAKVYTAKTADLYQVFSLRPWLNKQRVADL